MDLEREIKVRDAIKYCIENFDSKTATNRIVEFWKDELKLQEQAINYSRCCKSDSEQLPCNCGVKLKETTIQVFCPKCYKTWKIK